MPHPEVVTPVTTRTIHRYQMWDDTTNINGLDEIASADKIRTNVFPRRSARMSRAERNCTSRAGCIVHEIQFIYYSESVCDYVICLVDGF